MNILAGIGRALCAKFRQPRISITIRFKRWPWEKLMRNWKWFDLTKEPILQGVDPEVISLLDIARQKTIELDPNGKGTPFIVTSGRRTPDENAALADSAKRSAHIPRPPSEYATAVDLRCIDWRSAALMVFGLVLAGFRRIGIYYKYDGSTKIPTHIHGDMASDLPQPALWITEEK